MHLFSVSKSDIVPGQLPYVHKCGSIEGTVKYRIVITNAGLSRPWFTHEQKQLPTGLERWFSG